MGVQWPLALLSLLVLPLLVAAYVWQQPAAAQAGGAPLQRRADPGGGAQAGGVEAARAVRAGARRARAARRGGGPARRSAWTCRSPTRRSSSRSTCRARCAPPTSTPNRLTAAEDRGARVRAEPGRRHPDRAGRVLRVRPARRGADHRARRPCCAASTASPPAGARRSARPCSSPSTRSPRSTRRWRRRIPARAPTRPPRRGPGRRARYAPGDRRAAHRRRQHHRRRAGRRRQDRGGARGARLPDRVRHPQPGDDGLHGGPARRPRLRELRRRQPAGVAGGGYGGASARSYLVADEGTLREVANLTGGQYFAAADAGRLQDVLRDLPRTVATPAARRRGERRARGARRGADAGRPVGGGALVSGLVSAPSAAAPAAGGRARSAR